VRLFRPPVSRVLKKANRQIRETKEYLGRSSPTGVLLFVNDGFTTLNRCVEIKGSDVPRLVWAPTYSDRGDDSLHQFINDLGRKWFKFLESKIGPFTIDNWETEDHDAILGSKAIVLPDEHHG
jgi:hypothetical protein